MHYAVQTQNTLTVNECGDGQVTALSVAVRVSQECVQVEQSLVHQTLHEQTEEADDEAHRRLTMARDRYQRAQSGQAPAKDDASQIAKVRRRLARQQQGLPPAADDTSQIAKVRRRLAAKQNR